MDAAEKVLDFRIWVIQKREEMEKRLAALELTES